MAAEYRFHATGGAQAVYAIDDDELSFREGRLGHVVVPLAGIRAFAIRVRPATAFGNPASQLLVRADHGGGFLSTHEMTFNPPSAACGALLEALRGLLATGIRRALAARA